MVMVFCFVHNFFFEQHKSQNIYFFCRAKREIFFQNLTLGYMTKTLNQINFFSSTKIRIFFSATLGIRIFFQKKPITTPPLQVKWLFPNGIPYNAQPQALVSGKKNTPRYCSMFGIRDEISSGIWENDETREIRWEEEKVRD